jgi:nucleoside-diphosphate-sugar epimerase
MARRAADMAGSKRRVIGVSRFSSPAARTSVEEHGVETIAGDLLDWRFVESLPDAPLVVQMTGYKFGTSSDPSMTWAVNCVVPTLVCRRFAASRIAAFSTGNVYGLTPASGSGSRDRRVLAGETIDVTMSHVNVIWQSDASAMALLSLAHAASPAFVVNLAGPEILRVREVCETFGKLMNRPAILSGKEAPDALLSDGRLGRELFGPPRVAADDLIRWTAAWLLAGGETLNKPTHFETRDGKY